MEICEWIGVMMKLFMIIPEAKGISDFVERNIASDENSHSSQNIICFFQWQTLADLEKEKQTISNL